MGKRKRLAAEARKAARKTQYFAKAKSVPSSPRKMRYVVDLIRGMEVNRALATLHFNKKAAAADVVFVDEGATLKRMRPAPQGRGYRIRKRSNHVTLFVDTKTND